ncbi:hypothetical protein BaRGS_00015139 [Batillaria attramentaria]|uniref:Uncharacterized protein n=1 Tax=Batillaria attramentaria TaxID=370345 RepID=A0ABD0L2P1_9CAEN
MAQKVERPFRKRSLKSRARIADEQKKNREEKRGTEPRNLVESIEAVNSSQSGFATSGYGIGIHVQLCRCGAICETVMRVIAVSSRHGVG